MKKTILPDRKYSKETSPWGSSEVRQQMKKTAGDSKATVMGGKTGPMIDANAMALGKPVVRGHKSILGN